jgi:hypothetical protein
VILALLLVAVLAGTAGAVDIDLAAYRRAAQTGEVGSVPGRVYAESRTPTGPVRPTAGVAVTLLPRSEALVRSLEQIKEDSRRSARAFAAAAPAMRRAQDDYERALVVAGGPDLAPRLAAGADGTFRIPDVPAGVWILIAWDSSPVEVTGEKSKPRDRQTYRLGARLTGFESVEIWLRELTIAKGETVSVDLTDRNVWFRGVIEERTRDAGR